MSVAATDESLWLHAHLPVCLPATRPPVQAIWQHWGTLSQHVREALLPGVLEVWPSTAGGPSWSGGWAGH